MTFAIATAIVWFIQVYLLVGLVCALWLSLRGLGRLDAAAEGASLGFRLIVFPGLVLLWPWLARRLGGGSPATEHNAHRDAAGKSA